MDTFFLKEVEKSIQLLTNLSNILTVKTYGGVLCIALLFSLAIMALDHLCHQLLPMESHVARNLQSALNEGNSSHFALRFLVREPENARVSD